MKRSVALLLLLATITVAGIGASSAPPAQAMPEVGQDSIAETPVVDPAWLWPTAGPRSVDAPFRAPSHAYGPGHRGMDIAASAGTEVSAPAQGVVAFRGVVVDRPLITLAHEGGLVTTLEPVASELSPGDVIERGDIVGTVATGGHVATGSLHIGVRWHGAYVNPLPLFGQVPRAVLLPCCAEL